MVEEDNKSNGGSEASSEEPMTKEQAIQLIVDGRDREIPGHPCFEPRKQVASVASIAKDMRRGIDPRIGSEHWLP